MDDLRNALAKYEQNVANPKKVMENVLAAFARHKRKSLVPFDPDKHTPKDVGLGGPSTEYLVTDNHPDGGVFNYPSVWWGEDGEPVLLKGDEAYEQAIEYERRNKKRFPYYPDVETAVDAAKSRSSGGGASHSKLTNMIGSL